MTGETVRTTRDELYLKFLTESGKTIKQAIKDPIDNTDTMISKIADINTELAGGLSGKWLSDTADQQGTFSAITELNEVTHLQQVTEKETIFEE